jgi:lysozyme|tara:strand:+ start:639 stop:1079 length:441 start_codon:yes stop_codon:yes gene_type:complete
MNIERLRESIIAHEGIRYKAYADPILGETAMTTAVGHLIKLPEEEYLLEKELTMDEVMELLDNDIEIAVKDARRFIDEDSIPEEAFEIVVELSFQLGYPRLSGFKKFQAALKENNFLLAKSEMLDSKWARQVPARAKNLSDKMGDI